MRASAPMMPLRAKVSDENAAGAEIIIVGYSKRDSNGGKMNTRNGNLVNLVTLALLMALIFQPRAKE